MPARWQISEADDTRELVANSGHTYAWITFWPARANPNAPRWQAHLFTREYGNFYTETDAEQWVREKLSQMAVDLLEIAEL